MLICMRTTLVLDEALLRQAQRRAADLNLTLSDVVNEALRDALRSPRQTAPPFAMVTYGDGQPRVDHEPAYFADALETEDPTGLR